MTRISLFLTCMLFVLPFGCLFDSDSEKETDSGTYELMLDTLYVKVYPTGGAFIDISLIPSEDFKGDVSLSFKSPSFIHGSFYTNKMDIDNTYNDIVLSIDSTDVRGINQCKVLAHFAGKTDTVQIDVDILQGPEWPVSDFGIKKKDEFLTWYKDNYENNQLKEFISIHDYSLYPEDMLGGAGWIFISEQWIMTIGWPVIYQSVSVDLTKRGSLQSFHFLKEQNGIYHEIAIGRR